MFNHPPSSLCSLYLPFVQFRGVGVASSASWSLLTFLLLSAITAVAAKTSDVGLVVSLSGSLFGAALIYCVPSAIYLKAVEQSKIYATKQEVMMICVVFNMEYLFSIFC
jgi:hypothetical protein